MKINKNDNFVSKAKVIKYIEDGLKDSVYGNDKLIVNVTNWKEVTQGLKLPVLDILVHDDALWYIKYHNFDVITASCDMSMSGFGLEYVDRINKALSEITANLLLMIADKYKRSE